MPTHVIPLFRQTPAAQESTPPLMPHDHALFLVFGHRPEYGGRTGV